ncbi:MAG: replication endonuclease, partial [Delftia sp.]|nr:replication endonuclease [Delftia sp.]
GEGAGGAEGADTAPPAPPALPARAPLARAWTGFNNCTARLTGHTLRALIGRGGHQREDRANPSAPDSVLHRPASGATPSNHPFLTS